MRRASLSQSERSDGAKCAIELKASNLILSVQLTASLLLPNLVDLMKLQQPNSSGDSYMGQVRIAIEVCNVKPIFLKSDSTHSPSVTCEFG
jgi:hypothetical protein